jgi:hypothetical protein
VGRTDAIAVKDKHPQTSPGKSRARNKPQTAARNYDVEAVFRRAGG